MQNIIVAFIVGLAAAYAIWRWLPANAKRALAQGLAHSARRLGLNETQAQQLERKLESSGGCGSCDSCKACASPAEKTGQAIRLHK